MVGFAEDFDSIQEMLSGKASPKPKEGVIEEPEEEKLEELEPEEEEEVEEEEEEVVEKEEEEIEVEKKVSKKEEKIAEEVVKLLGEDTVLKVKGKDYRLKDLSKDEVVKYLQIGLRPNQIFEQLAAKEKQLDEREALVTRGAETVQRLIGQYGDRKPADKAKVPTYLETSEEDDDTTKALKETIKALSDKVQSMESGSEEAKIERQVQSLKDEIEVLKRDYPSASLNEVIAIKSIYPHIATEKIMEASNKYYGSRAFLDTVLAANPDLKRELNEEAVKTYLKKEKKVIPRKRTSQVSAKVGGEKTAPVKDFEDADARARKYLAGLMKARAEEE